MVPIMTIVCTAIAAVVGIGLPVGLFLGFRRSLGLRAVPMLVGALVFLVFAMGLEQVLHLLVLRPQPDGSNALLPISPWLYVAYGALAAGVFEETGRFVGFTVLKRRYQGARTAVAYGIGHGGIESILVLGLTMISNLVVAVVINSGMGSFLPAAVTEQLASTPSWMFLLGALERVLAVTVHLSLSVLVWTAVTHAGRRWLFPLAIVLHAVMDVPAVMMQAGILTSVVLTEVLTAVITVAIAGYAVVWFRRALAAERLAADAAS